MAKRGKGKKSGDRAPAEPDSISKGGRAVAKRTKAIAEKLSDSPILLETVAAILVAAAGALRTRSKGNPVVKTGILALIVMEIAQRSIDAIGQERKPRARRSKSKG